MVMKTIEERAKEWAYRYPMTPDGYLTENDMRAVATNSYIQGATEQKAIDDAERVNQVLTGNGSAINHYNQGFQDAVEKAMFYLKARSEYPFDKLQDSFITFMKGQL